MSYTPTNLPIYLAAFGGAISGMTVSNRVITDPDSADYASLIAAAGAFAEEFDTVWGSSDEANTYELENIQSLCISAWQERTPFTIERFHEPDVYEDLCLALLAVCNCGSAYLTSEGITPPLPGSGLLPDAGDVIIDPGNPAQNIVVGITGDAGAVTVDADTFDYAGSVDHELLAGETERVLVDGTVITETSEDGFLANTIETQVVNFRPADEALGGVTTENQSEGNATTGVKNYVGTYSAPNDSENTALSITLDEPYTYYRVDVTFDMSLDGQADVASFGYRIIIKGNAAGELTTLVAAEELFATGDSSGSGSPPTGWAGNITTGAGSSILSCKATADAGVLVVVNAQVFSVTLAP